MTKHQALEAIKRAREIRIYCPFVADESGRLQGAYFRIKRKASLSVRIARASDTDNIAIRGAPGEPGVLLVG